MVVITKDFRVMDVIVKPSFSKNNNMMVKIETLNKQCS